MLDFLGIGAQKAGTTWLYEQLRQHPQLAFPLGKEAHFWNRPHNQADIAGYLGSFSNATPAAQSLGLRRWLRRSPALPNPRLFGEITPAYGILPLETVQEIHSYAPDLRLLYLMRNPIERAWSSALMALQRAEMTIEEASDQWFIDHFHSAASRRRGDYQACLQTWRSVFRHEQLLVLRFEELVSAPEMLLNRCFAHLGVERRSAAQLQQAGCHNAVFVGTGQPLRPSLRPVLQTLYQAPMTQLATYLDTDLSAWLAS